MNNTNKADFAILLAGGKSSRMNQDKALLDIAGTTLLGFQKDRLASVAEHVIISRNDDNPMHIKDTRLNYGPLAGIHACLGHIKVTSGMMVVDALIMPVDMPLMSKALISHLIQYGKMHKKACHFSNHFLPIYVPDVAVALDVLDDMIINELHLVNTFVEKLDADDIECMDKSKLANANTPMQWKIMTKQLQAS